MLMSKQKPDKRMLHHLDQIPNSYPKFYTQVCDLEEIPNLWMDYISNVPFDLETQDPHSYRNDDINVIPNINKNLSFYNIP